MAKKKKSDDSYRGGYNAKPAKRRPGVHSKKRVSKIKKSKHYIKSYKGQGR